MSVKLLCMTARDPNGTMLPGRFTLGVYVLAKGATAYSEIQMIPERDLRNLRNQIDQALAANPRRPKPAATRPNMKGTGR